MIEGMTAYCPRCGKRQGMLLEAATCVRYGLLVHIQDTNASSPFDETKPASHTGVLPPPT